ncbi:ATP diphosphatase [Mesocricetibacter intestinalis]|uniref:Nucleoside triphosphate pyrophosphohydrolase n=1 Tax=Mesocricetibacter intestinalis TaxID=1521930 RepID=A0A4R6VD10_9PAST|nr:nucleoside triphosphate pyrophosphohydrolase [Mesocricetibacter intestinalis]TDQ58135.1 ATP diphosphatase [Mesocricetibacter intestinalis]
MQTNIDHFVRLIAKLRDPKDGCPWDLKQNYRSMIPCVLEESYEVIEAIEQNNMQNLREELGDLLLQVVFLSQLAAEEQIFTFEDVVCDISEKILRRHPHVFGDKSATNEQEALENWNAVKAEENQKKAYTSILDNIPQAFPALMRAEKLQKRCAKVGFDWEDINQVAAKVEEELQEVRQELACCPPVPARIEEEIGDLLFAAVNLARHAQCRPEESLRKANRKFERRFRAVEKKLKQEDKDFSQTSLQEMDLLWDEIKKQEK